MNAQSQKIIVEQLEEASKDLAVDSHAKIISFPDGRKLAVMSPERAQELEQLALDLESSSDAESEFYHDDGDNAWLTGGVVADLKEGLADVKAGRVHSLEDVEHELFG